MANTQCILEIHGRRNRKDGRIYETREQKIMRSCGPGINQGACLWEKLKLRASSAEVCVAGAGKDKKRHCLLMFGFCSIWGNRSCNQLQGKVAPPQISSHYRNNPQHIGFNVMLRYKYTKASVSQLEGWFPTAASSAQQVCWYMGWIHCCAHYVAGRDRCSKSYK